MRLACLALLGAALLQGEGFTQADLQRWLTVWQQKEQLQDWTLEITVARQKDLGRNVGDSYWIVAASGRGSGFLMRGSLSIFHGKTSANIRN